MSVCVVRTNDLSQRQKKLHRQQMPSGDAAGATQQGRALLPSEDADAIADAVHARRRAVQPVVQLRRRQHPGDPVTLAARVCVVCGVGGGRGAGDARLARAAVVVVVEGTIDNCAATLWVCGRVGGRRLSAIISETPCDLIMNFTARYHQFSVLITAAWRACLPVVTNHSIAIHHTTSAEPLGTIGIRMRILRAACVLIVFFPLTASTSGTRRRFVFNLSAREHEVCGLVSPARLPWQTVVADHLGSVRCARVTQRARSFHAQYEAGHHRTHEQVLGVRTSQHHVLHLHDRAKILCLVCLAKTCALHPVSVRVHPDSDPRGFVSQVITRLQCSAACGARVPLQPSCTSRFPVLTHRQRAC